MALGDLTQSLAADPTYGTSDPETIKRKQLLAAALMNQGMSTEPIRSPWQGAANLAKALIGGYQGGAADREAQAGRKSVLPDLNTAIQPRAVTTPSQAMTTADASGGPIGTFGTAVNRTLGFEGGLNPSDTNGTPSNYGINAKANPGVDVNNLTQDKARGIYKSNYWDAIKGDELAKTNPALAHVAFDTAVIAGPGKAQELIAASGGDPNKLLALREQFQNRLLASDPDKYGPYAKAWSNRLAGLRSDIAGAQPGGVQVASADPSFAPQSNQPDFSGAPMPPPRPDDVGMPNSVRPVAKFTNAPIADATDAADGEDKPAPAQVAQAAPAAAASPMADPRVAAAYRVASNPWATPAWQQIAMTIIKDAMTQKSPVSVSPGASLVDPATGRVVYTNPKSEKDDKTSEIKNYEYYRTTVPAGQTPMPFDVWSTAKARAAATNVTTNVEAAKPDMTGRVEGAKIDAETVRKGMNEEMPQLDDADHNFQLMQAAIDRNGGKLPTGGEMAKLGLDINRAKQYIADNWGVNLGTNPDELANLETFNKGGMKASGDMAKAIGGSRVLKVEFEMAQRANPGIDTSDFGNKYLIDTNRNSIGIKRDYLQAREDYWRQNNHSLDGFQKSWNAEIKANPRPLSSYSVAPPIPQPDGTQLVKLPSTGPGGYTWFKKGPEGLSPAPAPEQGGATPSAPSAKGEAPIPVQTPAEADKLPPGTKFRTPDGRLFVR